MSIITREDVVAIRFYMTIDIAHVEVEVGGGDALTLCNVCLRHSTLVCQNNQYCSCRANGWVGSGVLTQFS